MEDQRGCGEESAIRPTGLAPSVVRARPFYQCVGRLGGRIQWAHFSPTDFATDALARVATRRDGAHGVSRPAMGAAKTPVGSDSPASGHAASYGSRRDSPLAWCPCPGSINRIERRRYHDVDLTAGDPLNAAPQHRSSARCGPAALTNRRAPWLNWAGLARK